MQLRMAKTSISTDIPSYLLLLMIAKLFDVFLNSFTCSGCPMHFYFVG